MVHNATIFYTQVVHRCNSVDVVVVQNIVFIFIKSEILWEVDNKVCSPKNFYNTIWSFTVHCIRLYVYRENFTHCNFTLREIFLYL